MKNELGKKVFSGKPEGEKFDMLKEPMGQKWYFMILVWPLSYIMKWLHLGKVKYINMDNVKPPYILICNHNAFYDFYIMSAILCPKTGYFPAAVDDFIGREGGLRRLGAIPKRKFTADISLIRQCRKVLKEKKSIFGIYAEAKYSLCGLTEPIPESIGQLAKSQGVPVVTLKMCGHHIYDPFWANHKRKRWVIPVEATITQIFTSEQIKETSVDEINEKIKEALHNDDFRWQKERKVKISYRNRAQGLHKVLYQCPNCMTEYKMDSKGSKIYCKECKKSWTLSCYGELIADSGNTEFQFPTDWYVWEREQVRNEVRNGKYHFSSPVHVNDLYNSKGFVRKGNGELIHDYEGFRLKGINDYDSTEFSMTIPAASQFSLHVEFNYRFGNRKDCIDLNTLEDTWYVFPEKDEFSVTKIALATEEIYNLIKEKKINEK